MIETPWQKVTTRLKLKGSGPVFAARCPAHDDKRESLSVTQNAHGDVLLTCHAGCDVEDIVARLDLQMQDLFWPEEVDQNAPPTVYVYRDEHGIPLIEVEKTWDKRFRQRKAGSDEWKLGDARRVPYRLPELLRAKPSDLVFIVEGEKDVENAVAKLGVVATTNIGGAGKGKWRSDWNEFFSERHVVVVPDNDEVGRHHAEEIQKTISEVAGSVVILHLPNLPEKGDLSDWIKNGGTREQLLKLVEAARLNKHPHVIFATEIHDRVFDLYHKGFEKGLSTGWSSVDPHFTVRPGELTVVTGAPGAGKSSWIDHLMINLATRKMKFGVFSAENLPIERHEASLAERYVGKPFEAPTTSWGRERMTERELEIATSFIEDHFDFIEPQEMGQTIDDILEAARWLIDKKDVNGLLLDPWNQLSHTRSKGLTETEYIADSLKKIRLLVRQRNVHFFVVAHPQKMQRMKDGKYPVPTLWDISGSSHWFNMTDNGVVIYRDRDADDGVTELHVQKIRFKEVGHVGMVQLSYDKPTGQFRDLVTKEDLFSGVRDDDDD